MYGKNSGLTEYNTKRYNEGRWGGGTLNAVDLAKKFNLDRTEGAASGEQAIYGTNADGSRVFIGNTHKNMGELTKNSELIQAHGRQAHEGEGNHAAQGDAEISSDGDVKGAILNLWKKGAAPEAEPEPVDTSKPASQKLTKAQSYTQAYSDFRKSGGAVEQMAGNLGARDEFLDNYKLNIQRRMEPGVANAVGNDDLPPMEGAPDMDKKRSKIAADIVGKKAGFGQVWPRWPHQLRLYPINKYFK